MRNIKRNMSRKDAAEFVKELRLIGLSPSFEQGRRRFLHLLDRYKEKYPRYTALLREKTDDYLAFLKYPEGIRKHLYTTNTVESLGSILEELRYEKRGHFQSQKVLEVNIMLAYKRFREGRWKRKIPTFEPYSYDILQLFNLRFSQTQETR